MQKIEILFLGANPTDTTRLRLDQELRTIQEKISASKYHYLLELVSDWAVRPDDLLQIFNQRKPQIVHFSGHGSQWGELLLEDKHGKARAVGPEALKALFTTLKGDIQVVFLNACYSEVQANGLVEVIDCVIDMNARIGDQAAIEFAAAFYQAIGFGHPVQKAFDLGKVALLLEDIPEENIPRLLVKSGVDPTKKYLTASRQASAPVEVFMSYAHEDKDLRDKLANHLSNLRKQGIISDWYDGDIIAGSERDVEIHKHLNAAQIILLLISADFIASDMCYSVQMKRAIARHNAKEARVLPIILRPVDYEGAPFDGLEALPKNNGKVKPVRSWSDSDEAFKNIVQGIREAIKELNSGGSAKP